MKKAKDLNENNNHSTDKLLKITECLAANRLPKRLSELSRQLDMPQATMLRFLKTLCQQGYAYQDEISGGYALTWKICRLSDAVKINLALRSMAGSFPNCPRQSWQASVPGRSASCFRIPSFCPA